MKPPTPNELSAITADIIERIYAGGLAKHGEHVWYAKETWRHHTDRAIRHLCTSAMRRDGNESCDSDGETAEDHLERAIVRALFALVKLRHGHE